MDFDAYAEPRDLLAERSVVGGLLAGPIPDGHGLRVEDFWHPPLRTVAAACLHLAAAGKPTDPIAVRAELLRRGERGDVTDGAWLATLMAEGCMTSQLTWHARNLRELAVRRDVMFQARQALQQASNPATDPYEVAAALHVTAGSLADSGDPVRAMSTVDAEDFLAKTDRYDWLVPGLLERGDRFLITGGEGSGKASCVGSSQSPSRPARIPSLALTPHRNGSRSSTSRTGSATYGGRSGRCGIRPSRSVGRCTAAC